MLYMNNEWPSGLVKGRVSDVEINEQSRNIYRQNGKRRKRKKKKKKKKIKKKRTWYKMEK